MTSKSNTRQALVGIDLGGSYIKGGLVDPDGRIIRLLSPRPTGDIKQAIASVKALIDELLIQAHQDALMVAALGLSTCGVVNPEGGVVLESTSIPGYAGTSWFDHFDGYGIPVAIENDARAAAWAEFSARSDQRVQDWIHVPVGTSLACGIILGGRLWHGTAFSAGELGHITVEANGADCVCGNTGCLEGYVSTEAIMRYAQQDVDRQAGSLAFGSLQDVIAAAQSGDVRAIEAYATAGTYLGAGLTTLANLLNPQVITLGGGVVEASEVFYTAARDYVYRHALTSAVKNLIIEKGRLGNTAGFIGAARLAYQEWG